MPGFEPGLVFSYYEGRFRRLPDFSKEKVLKTGVVADFDIISIRDTADAYALVFDGLIWASSNGIYTFYCSSDDGSRILIDDRQILINDGLHEMKEATGQAALQKGFHRIRLEYFDYGGAEGLDVRRRCRARERLRWTSTSCFMR